MTFVRLRACASGCIALRSVHEASDALCMTPGGSGLRPPVLHRRKIDGDA